MERILMSVLGLVLLAGAVLAVNHKPPVATPQDDIPPVCGTTFCGK